MCVSVVIRDYIYIYIYIYNLNDTYFLCIMFKIYEADVCIFLKVDEM